MLFVEPRWLQAALALLAQAFPGEQVSVLAPAQGGFSHHSALVQIGAVFFNIPRRALGPTFLQTIHLADSVTRLHFRYVVDGTVVNDGQTTVFGEQGSGKSDAARYLQATDSLGAVAAGKLADLVVLDADPTDERTDLDAVGVRSTVIAGEVRYRSERPVRPPG